MAPESSYVKASEFDRLTIQTTLVHLPHVATLKTCYNNVQHQIWWSSTDDFYQQLFLNPLKIHFTVIWYHNHDNGVGLMGWCGGMGLGHYHIIIYQVPFFWHPVLVCSHQKTPSFSQMSPKDHTFSLKDLQNLIFCFLQEQGKKIHFVFVD